MSDFNKPPSNFPGFNPSFDDSKNKRTETNSGKEKDNLNQNQTDENSGKKQGGLSQNTLPTFTVLSLTDAEELFGSFMEYSEKNHNTIYKKLSNYKVLSASKQENFYEGNLIESVPSKLLDKQISNSATLQEYLVPKAVYLFHLVPDAEDIDFDTFKSKLMVNVRGLYSLFNPELIEDTVSKAYEEFKVMNKFNANLPDILLRVSFMKDGDILYYHFPYEDVFQYVLHTKE